MNPWAILIIGLGILLIIMGVKGSYGNVISAITGKPYKPTLSAQQSVNPPIPLIKNNPPPSPPSPGTPGTPSPQPGPAPSLGIQPGQLPILRPVGNIGQFFPFIHPTVPWGVVIPSWKVFR